MRIRHLRQENYTHSRWSGGTTTQLFIWPEGADYSARDFLFRISSATVEQERSTFTPLPGVLRYIAPLDGSFTLRHEGRHQAVLNPLDVDRFWGDWVTECVGRARDFNLMLKGCDGNLVRWDEGRHLLDREDDFSGIYAPAALTLSIGAEEYRMELGELLLISALAEDCPLISDGPLLYLCVRLG